MDAFKHERIFNFDDESVEQDLEFCAECGMTYLPHTMTLVHGFYYRPEYMCHDCLHSCRTNPDAIPEQWHDNEDGSVTYKYKSRKQIDLFKTLSNAMRPGGAI